MPFLTDVKSVRRLQRHKHGWSRLRHCMLARVVDDTLVKAFPLLHCSNSSTNLLPVDSLLELVSLQTADILNIYSVVNVV